MRGARRGFTLVEMIIVVLIVGVLAMLAVVGFRRLVGSAHTAEATAMIGQIRIAQEAYHSETLTYADISKSITSYYPQSSPSSQYVTGWGGTCGASCNGIEWTALPLHVDGPVQFGYATVAGAGNSSTTLKSLTAMPSTVTVNATSVSLPVASGTPTTDWYVIAAAGDTDQNGRQVFLAGSSFTNQLVTAFDGE